MPGEDTLRARLGAAAEWMTDSGHKGLPAAT